MRTLILVLSLSLALCAGAVADDASVYVDPDALNSALTELSEDDAKHLYAFVAGLEKGLAIANSRLLHGKKPRLYCAPDGEAPDERALVALYKAEHRRMVEEYGAAYVKKMSPSFVMLHAFEKKYPCS